MPPSTPLIQTAKEAIIRWKTPTLIATLTSLALLSVTPAAAADKSPYAKADDSWITISGTAVNTRHEAFDLDYGPAKITVEVDDWDTYDEAKPLIDGDKVTVYGKIDDDLYEMSKIEASSIYVDDLHTYLYANAADEEDVTWVATTPIDPSQVAVRGTVTKTMPGKNRMTIDSGDARLTVDLDGTGYNPVDDTGFQQIDVGDVVAVSGELDSSLMQGRHLNAEMVQTVYDLVASN